MTTQKTYLITWRFADGEVSTFEFRDRDKALWKYQQGKFGGRKVRGKVIPVVGVRAEEIRR